MKKTELDEYKRALIKSGDAARASSLELAKLVAETVKRIGMSATCQMALQSWSCSREDVQLFLDVAMGECDPIDPLVIELMVKMHEFNALKRN